MRALGVAIATAAVVVGLTGCGAARPQTAAPRQGIAIAADLPPSPATWPKYPHFSERSCSGRPAPTGNGSGEAGSAPSYAPSPPPHHLKPAEIVRRFLARFGDRRYIHSITFPVYFNGRPFGDQLGAAIDAPLANDGSVSARSTQAKILAHGIARWEAGLAFGALRDDFCAAGGPSLTGASLAGSSNVAVGTADELFALEQRFPNPSPATFRRRVALVGKRFGFRVVSLRLLRPEQIAPLLVVKTHRNREAFARDVPGILDLLNPSVGNGQQRAETFEGFFFTAEDAKGPFVHTDTIFRGQEEGGQWAASENLYPYPHG